jgi:hypothetical protein
MATPTKADQAVGSRTKAHTIYKNAAGVRVPGVTTITGVLNKPALVKWANDLGLQGIDSSKYVDEMAKIGTLAHYIVECHIRETMSKKKVEPDYSDATPNQIDLATNAALKFFEWENGHKVKYLATELILISEKQQVGGTCDIYCELDGKKTLIDLKTCKGIYPEQFTQVGAYAHLLTENGYAVEDVRILRIGRDESEGFEDKKVPFLDLHWERFKHCRAIYELNKTINKW